MSVENDQNVKIHITVVHACANQETRKGKADLEELRWPCEKWNPSFGLDAILCHWCKPGGQQKHYELTMAWLKTESFL